MPSPALISFPPRHPRHSNAPVRRGPRSSSRHDPARLGDAQRPNSGAARLAFCTMTAGAQTRSWTCLFANSLAHYSTKDSSWKPPDSSTAETCRRTTSSPWMASSRCDVPPKRNTVGVPFDSRGTEERELPAGLKHPTARTARRGRQQAFFTGTHGDGHPLRRTTQRVSPRALARAHGETTESPGDSVLRAQGGHLVQGDARGDGRVKGLDGRRDRDRHDLIAGLAHEAGQARTLGTSHDHEGAVCQR